MVSELTSPVPMSTADNHILTETEPESLRNASTQSLSDDEFRVQYEIERTLNEIRKNKWTTVALQFPDEMLGDSARVYQMLARGYRHPHPMSNSVYGTGSSRNDLEPASHLQAAMTTLSVGEQTEELQSLKLTILADTSYGSCCVDEIAAEHVDADAVVHYGRTCLSPTARMPVLYVYTKTPLDYDSVIHAFKQAVMDKSKQVIIVADVPYSHHVEPISSILTNREGYQNIHGTEIVRDTSSLIPNRTLPEQIASEPDQKRQDKMLEECTVFHISNPPTSLLLTLESRVHAVHILPVASDTDGASRDAVQTNTTQVLRRRYALIASLTTVSTWGILINTLSVKNYLHIVEHVKKQIADAGKKSYLFVVGKINPAKVANFAEIGGWIVIGCWESSLIDSRDFYRPIITPFELGFVLQSDEERVWTGEWRSDFQAVLDRAEQDMHLTKQAPSTQMPGAFVDDDGDNTEPVDYESEEDDSPPEFDLRTGRYISKPRPMRAPRSANTVQASTSTALTKRSDGQLLLVKGVVSPAAEFLAQKRTWKGLGSDFEIKYDEEEEEHGALIEEGRTGVARGYTVGESERA